MQSDAAGKSKSRSKASAATSPSPLAFFTPRSSDLGLASVSQSQLQAPTAENAASGSGSWHSSGSSNDSHQYHEDLQLESAMLVDDSLRHCKQCLMDFQAEAISKTTNANNKPTQLSMSKVTKYSSNTATSSMLRHLYDVHSISLSAQSQTQAAKVVAKGQPKISFTGKGNDSSKVNLSKTAATLNEDLLTWIALDGQPFSCVNKEGLQYLFKRQMPHLCLPSEDTLRRTTLPLVYKKVKTTLMQFLAEASTLCIMYDGWSDKHNARHFLGIRVAFISEQ